MKSITTLIVFVSLVSLCQSQLLYQHIPKHLLEQRMQISSEWNQGLQQRLEEVNQNRNTANKIDESTVLGELFRLLKGTSFPTAVATNISQQCIDDSQKYVAALYHGKKWALEMHESTGNGQLGFFKNLMFTFEYGLFDECLAVRAPDFKGKYCASFYFPTTSPVDETDQTERFDQQPNNLNTNVIDFFFWFNLLTGLNGRQIEPKVFEAPPGLTGFLPGMAFCIPSSCSSQDFGKAVAQLVGSSAVVSNGTEISIATLFSDGYCDTDSEDPPKFDGADITVLVLLSVIGLLVVVASIHEFVRSTMNCPVDTKSDGLFLRALHCFSAINNGRKLLSTKTGAGNLGCLNGIRVMSTFWVVMGHSLLNFISGPNRFLVLEDSVKWSFQTLENATISVDTFFLISGFLVAYLLLKELDRNKGRFNIALFYLHRYLRLTPVYAIILGFVATLLVYIGSGPAWSSVVQESEQCRQHWWNNLLYINNLVDEDACMGVTWYLANDMQFYLISPLLIYPLWRWGMYGVIWVAMIGLASFGITINVFVTKHYNPTVFALRQDPDFGVGFMKDYYTTPWCRIPPYLVGILLGYILHTTKKSQFKLPKLLVALGWAFATAIALAVLYGLSGLLDPATVPEIDEATKVIYGTFHRTAWAIAVGWLIFACCTGNGGPVNSFLSWKVFIPLSRMTYCVYLLHLSCLLNVYIARLRAPLFYNTFESVQFMIGIITTAFGLAFICSVTIEASFLNLEKLLFSAAGSSSKRANDNKLAIPVGKVVDPEIATVNTAEKKD